jgi:UDP-N-acetylmuramoyl-tripeptide--D-alanyl-D-alanine ligase
VRWDPQSLARATQGRLLRSGSRPIASVFIDSRAPIHDGVFVPIVAVRDGHDFIPGAIEGGASAVLVAPGRAVPDADVTVVEVADTLEALSALGGSARDNVAGPVIAITGSNGKTTTRAMTQAALETGFARVLCTRGNLNNHLGVPLTLCGEPDDPAAAVIEIGMSAPGEVDALCAVARPHVAVITSIALEHVETMRTLEAIAKAEFEAAAHLPDGGALVIPDDEPRLAALVDDQLRARCRVLEFGTGPGADVRIEGAVVGPPTRATLVVGSQRLDVQLQTFGAHNLRNAAAATCVALHLGLDLDGVAAALGRVVPVGDRGRTLAWNEHLVIADCYNANPGSMEVALASLGQLRSARPGPLVAVLGDMLELGPDTAAMHESVGKMTAGLDAVIGFGRLGEHVVAGANAVGTEGLHVVDDIAAVGRWLRGRFQGAAPGGVLLKASRGMRLERLLEALGLPGAS